MLELVRQAPVQDAPPPRADQWAIAALITKGAKVLEIGCGDGALLHLLARERGARARGIEPDRAKAHACVARGLSVMQCELESALAEFPTGAFDVVIFSHTLQGLRDPHWALREAQRVGERVIVSIANAAHWRARLRLMLAGRALSDEQSAIAYRWSVRDFAALARAARLHIERATPLSRGNPGAPFAKSMLRANWFGEEAVFLLAP